jgi:hypothetical protein
MLIGLFYLFMVGCGGARQIPQTKFKLVQDSKKQGSNRKTGMMIG